MAIQTDDKVILYKDLKKVIEKLSKHTTDAELLLNSFYPKGTVLITYENVNPGTYIGGVWELISQGRALFGYKGSDADFSSAGKQGGGKTAIAKMMIGWNNSEGNYLSLKQNGTPAYSENLSIPNFDTYRNTTNTRSNGVEVVTRDGNTLNNNALPPYETVFVWRRTDDNILAANFSNIEFNEEDFNISNNIISLKNSGGGVYTAGNGIIIDTNKVVSFDGTTLPGYDAAQEQVLKNLNGTISWGTGGGSSSGMPAWEYIGELGISGVQNIQVPRNDWTEMLFILCGRQSGANYNSPQIVPRVAFTRNSPDWVHVMYSYIFGNTLSGGTLYSWRIGVAYDATTMILRQTVSTSTSNIVPQPTAVYIR